MAEVQDEDQWLYGDDKGEQSKGKEKGNDAEGGVNNHTDKEEAEIEQPKIQDIPEDTVKPPESEKVDETISPEKKKDDVEEQQNGEVVKDVEDDSSSDDEATVTIGKIVKQPDIIRPPPPTHRGAAPTSSLKDDDFTSVGKINGVLSIDFNLNELEDKPWRKPGADLSDYFNYGFNEETWFKYCERQKIMRNSESGTGLTSLGITKLFQSGAFGGGGSTSSNEYYSSRHYNSAANSGHTASQKSQGNTIQVMTADRRIYSNKVLNQMNDEDNMDFGAGYNNSVSSSGEYFNPGVPPPSFFNTPPPVHGPTTWAPNAPPPQFSEPPPKPVPPPAASFYDDIKVKIEAEERELDSSTPKTREIRDRDSRETRHRDKDREKMRRSRSHSRTRHTRRRSRSRSPTAHRHKRKKSKRERSRSTSR